MKWEDEGMSRAELRIDPASAHSQFFCLTDGDSFSSGSSDWKEGRKEENCPFWRGYYESGAVQAECFDISYSNSQLPYKMGLISSISKMKQLRLRKPQ